MSKQFVVVVLVGALMWGCAAAVRLSRAPSQYEIMERTRQPVPASQRGSEYLRR